MSAPIRLLSIDPGTKGIGLAVWDHGALAHVEYLGFQSYADLRVDLSSWHANDVVCEVPQVYRADRSKGDPNDLINLAVVAGVCLCSADSDHLVRPAEWKGQVPKDVHNRRVLAKVPDDWQKELRAIPVSKRHNVIDAVGLGQWWLERRGT